MARVNVETRALAEGRFTAFAEDLKMSRWEAIGLLVMFWHDSQEREVWKAARAEVIRFVPDRTRREEIFKALVEQEYVSECPDGEFTIHGNRKHIEAYREISHVRREAGIMSGEARRRKSNKISDDEQITRCSEPNTIHSNTMQFNATHCKATQSTSEHGEPAPESAPPFSLSGEPEEKAASAVFKLWAAYREAFHDRYQFDPPGGDRKQMRVTLGKLKAVLSKIPEEAAPDVARFYVEHNDAFYVRSQHAIGPLIAQADALYSQWKRGKAMLPSQAREVERREHNGNAFDLAFANFKSMGMKFAGT